MIDASIEIQDSFESEKFNNIWPIKILSNVVIYPLSDILGRALKEQNFNADIRLGSYDNILQEASGVTEKILLVFWELSQLTNHLGYRVSILQKDEINRLIAHFKSEVDLFVKYTKNVPLVLFNYFSCQAFMQFHFNSEVFKTIQEELNNHIQSLASSSSNIKMIDIDTIIYKLGVNQTIDWRFLMLTRSPYTYKFYKAYCDLIIPKILSLEGKVKKAIIFDCDNTLWGGIVGEIGIPNIQMSFNDKLGAAYAAVQTMAHLLAERGIIIGLCSKNNEQIVTEVFRNHPECILREEDITIKVINWNDKATNLYSIAETLQISLSSIVYVDDSDFEIDLISTALPEVSVIRVPDNKSEYPNYFAEKIRSLFALDNITAVDLKRKLLYKTSIEREECRKKYSDIQGYLASLGLKLSLFIDRKSDIIRAEQLCQRTNQFNLTTKRYTASDIERFMSSDEYIVYTFNLEDKFGDYGLSGLAIVKRESQEAIIDTFLMSCRVIGRNAEFCFLNSIIEHLKKFSFYTLTGLYFKNDKNIVAEDFYRKYDMHAAEKSENYIIYTGNLTNLTRPNIPYIQVEANDE